MRRSVLIGCICLLASAVTAHDQNSDTNLSPKAIRAFMEDKVRQGFEKSKNFFFDEAKKKISGGPPRRSAG